MHMPPNWNWMTVATARWCATIGVAALLQVVPAPVGAEPTCVGDCDGRDGVAVNEILKMVNIALGDPPASCLAGDANHDGQVTVNEILAAVNNALDGCPTPGTTPTPSATATRVFPTATATVPTTGHVVFREGWERAAVRRYAPDSRISGDTGKWEVGDTVSGFPECGPSPHFAEVVRDGATRRLHLHSGSSDLNEDCADNIEAAHPTLRIPVTDDLYLSFTETGELVDPDECDAVFLHVEFDNFSRLSYVLQQGGGHGRTARSWGCGGLFARYPVILDPTLHTHVRNLVADMAARRSNRVYLPEIVFPAAISVTQSLEAALRGQEPGRRIDFDFDYALGSDEVLAPERHDGGALLHEVGPDRQRRLRSGKVKFAVVVEADPHDAEHIRRVARKPPVAGGAGLAGGREDEPA